MSKNVTFNLGPTVNLATRQLTVTRMMRAGDDSAPSAEHDADAGGVETKTITLPDNQIWQAKLVDTLSTGEVIPTQVIQFNTGSLQHLGPASTVRDGSVFRVLHMEDQSSSSSSSSPSSSSPSSSSSSSPSSSSPSSSSSSSSQSSSSSSSSISTSSQSSSNSSSSSSSEG